MASVDRTDAISLSTLAVLGFVIAGAALGASVYVNHGGGTGIEWFDVAASIAFALIALASGVLTLVIARDAAKEWGRDTQE
jgi:hypothetical protein